MKRFLSFACAVLMITTIITGCGQSATSEEKGINISIAIPKYTYDDTVKLINSFEKSHPDIKVKTISFDSDPAKYLTAQALNKSMPDLVFEDWDNIPFYISQGWLMPLDKYFNADTEKKYVPTSLTSNLTYGGKLYALPCKLEFDAIFMNTDLLETLNIEKPKYDWTIDDFIQIMKKATTTKYSGIEKLWGFDEKFAAENVKDGSLYGYNIATHKFDFSNSWVQAVSTFNSLRAVPGLEAWSLRGTDNAKYIQKFGSSGDINDLEMAWKTGNVLCDGQLTSERGWMRMMPFTYDVYPYPTYNKQVGQKIGINANSSYMLSTCKNPESAFQLLKFLTYGEEGQKLKLQTYLSHDADDPNSGLLEYFAPTTDPVIMNMLTSSPKVLPGLKYLATHMQNIYRSDLSKIVPNWEQINNELISDKGNSVRDGKAEAAAIATELDQKANEQITQAYAEFNKKLK